MVIFPDNTSKEDTISVRDDEKFNESILVDYLKDKIEGANLPLKVRQFGGGAANLTYLLKFGNKIEYVLRRPPLGPVAKSAHDMGREYKVLSVLFKKFPFAPRAYHYCNDFNIIGSNFFVMARKKGFVIRNNIPDFLKNKPEVIKGISESLIDRLVEFHAINYKELGLESLGKPEGFISRQVDGWFKRWEKAKEHDLKDMKIVYSWLKKNLPSESRQTIVHNDFKLDNVMFDYSNPSKMVAVFDWDMCTLGNPLSDLGSILAYWSEPNDPEYLKATSTMPINIPDFLTREELIKRYELKSGYSIPNISFYHVLGVFRLVVIVAQIYIRFIKKQTQDQRFVKLGNVIPLLAKRAVELTY